MRHFLMVQCNTLCVYHGSLEYTDCIISDGKMTDVHGDELVYDTEVQHKNTAGVIATPKGIDHQKYIHSIPQTVKDKLPAHL